VVRSLAYPGAGQARPHAPTQVDGQAYAYDNGGAYLIDGGMVPATL